MEPGKLKKEVFIFKTVAIVISITVSVLILPIMLWFFMLIREDKIREYCDNILPLEGRTTTIFAECERQQKLFFLF